MRPTVFLGHNRLGDNLILASAVIYLSKDKPIIVPCLSQYSATIQSLYVDVPNVTVLTCPNQWSDRVGVPDMDFSGKDILRFGFTAEGTPGYQPPNGGESFDLWWFRQLGIPWSIRWDLCPIRSSSFHVAQEPMPEAEYAFVFDVPSRGMTINRKHIALPIFYPEDDPSRSILRFRDIVENASSIHSVQSSLAILIDAFHLKCKPVLHEYARRDTQNAFLTAQRRLDWEVLA